MAFITGAFAFILGLTLLILGILFYYPYLKNKFKHEYGTKRNNILEYINDAFKILGYHRSIGLI